ncbi:hypothetical protein V8B55DRAFT_1556431 [Mucor lusitanicus]
MTLPPSITRTSTAPVLVTNDAKSTHPSPPIVNTNTSQLQFKLAKQRPLHFKARLTQFDLSNTDSSNGAFRGFYTLFWIAMGMYVIQSIVRCYEQEGILLSLGFYRLISEDGLALLISDLTMVSMTYLVFSFKAANVGRPAYETFGVVIQHTCQALFLFVNIYWTFWRNWPWVQSGFFTMHTIVMMMKTHSYTALNGDLSSEIAFLEGELVHGNTRYPDNVTIANFLDYLLVPSLVTDKIRVWYVFEKTTATLGSFLMLYVTTERWILPKLYDPNMSEPRVILELLFPFMINYLFIFYIIFECILNAFAELSRFADRNFYDDWWNSVTYDEFAVMEQACPSLALRHVYAQSIESYKLSKTNATFVTFLLSSIFHELVLIIVTHKIRLYMFFIQMLQLPMIVIGRMPLFRNRFWLAFWASWGGPLPPASTAI